MAVLKSCRRFLLVQTRADLVLWSVVAGALTFELVEYVLRR